MILFNEDIYSGIKILEIAWEEDLNAQLFDSKEFLPFGIIFVVDRLGIRVI